MFDRLLFNIKMRVSNYGYFDVDAVRYTLRTIAAIFLLILIRNLFWDCVNLVKEFITRLYYHSNYLSKLPGPKRYPIIGNYFEFFHPQGKLFKNFREHGKKYPSIYLINMLHIYVVNMLHPDDIQQILVNPIHESKCFIHRYMERLVGDSLILAKTFGPKWRPTRRLLTPAFHFNCLPGFVTDFNKQTENLLQDLSTLEGTEVDILPIMVLANANSLFASSMKTFGLTEEIKNYIQLTITLGNIMGERINNPIFIYNALDDLFSQGKTFEKLSKSVKGFFHSVALEREKFYLSPESLDIIKENEINKTAPMLDLLLGSKQKGFIDYRDIEEELSAFTTANSFTTGITISTSLMLLACHKDIQDTVYHELVEVLGDKKQPTYKDLDNLKYMERCLKETMRLYPGLPIICRTSGEDYVSKSGYRIPKDAPLLLHVYDLHRHPDFWPEPEKFDPDRFLPDNSRKRHPFAYIPFSAGARNCIGQRFAMFEMKSILCAVLRNYSLEPIDRPETLVFLVEPFLWPKTGVKVKLVKRNSS